MLRATRHLNMVIIPVKTCKIRHQITKLLAGHDFAARSCYDIDLQGSNPNLRVTCYFAEGHVVTLAFKVTTQMLRATRHFNMVIIFLKYFQNPTSKNKVMDQTRFC